MIGPISKFIFKILVLHWIGYITSIGKEFSLLSKHKQWGSEARKKGSRNLPQQITWWKCTFWNYQCLLVYFYFGFMTNTTWSRHWPRINPRPFIEWKMVLHGIAPLKKQHLMSWMISHKRQIWIKAGLPTTKLCFFRCHMKARIAKWY